jgi:23S rRNA (adenine-N6)-dimethyltransferase
VAGRRTRGARPPSTASRHFLRAEALAAELVRDAGVGPNDLVLDLGAGTGRLTGPLARAARRVIAVELDAALAAGLRGRWPNVEVIEGDAAQVRLPTAPFRVVANLPFSRTNDLLHLLLDDPRTPLIRADLIVEWGVAVKRALPWPSSVSSVVWGACYETAVTRRLPRAVFDPPPSVDTGVLVFRRRAVPLITPDAASSYHAFVAGGFRHGLHSVGVRMQPGTFARDLDPHQWANLFDSGSTSARRAHTRRAPT